MKQLTRLTPLSNFSTEIIFEVVSAEVRYFKLGKLRKPVKV